MTPVSDLKIDGGIPLRLERAADGAEALERDGYDGGWTAETSHDPFLPLLLAAEHTSRLELGTNIAVAFARNPMIVANVGWDLQAYSKGRFILGLGTQIQPHIEKRFSMPWSHPARRMREFVAALHAIWSAWKDGTKLRFEGEFYTHKIMTPMFTPEPHPYPAPKIFMAAVGEAMTEMCGEVADGHLGHPMVSKRYLDEVTMPALLRGMAASRPRSQRFPGVGRGDGGDRCRTTPNWRPRSPPPASRSPSTDQHRPTARCSSCTAGVTCTTELNRLSLQGEWDAMGSLIDDDMLNAFAVVGPGRHHCRRPRKSLRRRGRSGAADLLFRIAGLCYRRTEGVSSMSAPTVDEAAKVFADPLAYADEPRLHAALTHLRRNAPVSWVEVPDYRPFWAITKYADIMDIERENMLFTNWPRPVLATVEGDEMQTAAGVRTLIHMDDPQHRVVRAIGADWFRPKAMRALKMRVDELAKIYVDKMMAAGPECDFVQQVAVNYPLYVIMSLLGIPEADFPRMLKLTQELFGSDDSEFKRGTSKRTSCRRCWICSSTSTV